MLVTAADVVHQKEQSKFSEGTGVAAGRLPRRAGVDRESIIEAWRFYCGARKKTCATNRSCLTWSSASLIIESLSGECIINGLLPGYVVGDVLTIRSNVEKRNAMLSAELVRVTL